MAGEHDGAVVETLRLSEERFRLLVESVKDYAIFMLDPHGIVATWNIGAERIKGYKAHEIIGRSFETFYSPEVAATGKCAYELEVAARDGRFEDEGWRVRKDGSQFWANVVITALRDERGVLVGFAKVTRDLTERVQAEQQRMTLAQIEHTALLLTQLIAVAGALGAARTPEEIAKVIVERGTDALHAESAVLACPVRGSERELEIVSAHGGDTKSHVVGQRIATDSASPLAVAYRTSAAQWSEGPGDGGVASLPLVAAGRVIGVVSYAFERARKFPTDERALLQTTAAQAAAALDRANAYTRERDAHDRLRVLMELSDALSSTLELDDVARVIVERSLDMAHADTCTLYSLDETQSGFDLVREHQCAPEIIEKIRHLPIEGALEATFVETPEEYDAHLPALARASATGPRARAYWRMPLVAEGKVVGLLGMGYFAPRAFARDERDLIAAFARQCAEAMLRATRLDAERETRARLSTTLHSIGDAVVATDTTGAITMMNPVAESLTKWSESEARGRRLAEVFRIVNEHTRAVVPSPVDQVLELRSVVGLANGTLLVQRDGGEIPIEDSGAPIRAESGDVEGVVLVFRDATAKKRQEWRRAFLAEATASFAESLEHEETLRRAVRLAVPRLGDWCAVDIVVAGEERPKRLAVAHADPAKVDLVEELERRYPPDPNAKAGVPKVLRTGESELYRDVPDAMLVAGSVDEEQLRIARSLGLRSALIVPIVARGRVLGAMSFVMAESGRRYDDDDVMFAEDLGRRLGVAVENAQLYQAEQRARREADIANRSKDEFLAIVSHELRTPLNAILGWSKLMSAPTFDDSRRTRAVETIGRNAVSMAQLVEDLLDMSRITSGKMRLDVHPVPIESLIASTLESARPAADAKDIRIATHVDAGLPAVSGDSGRLQQIVWNLVSNAVKFTPNGGSVLIQAREVEGTIEMVVSDTGIGIAPRFLPYVFDAFSQEDARTTRARGGLGLGLAITRRLVELHGGRITVDSGGEGRGTRFTVTLPVGRARTRSDAPPKREATPTRELRDLRVLVVDDDADARELVQTILGGSGADVAAAASVDEALAALGQRPFDVLLADISMPGRDGYDLIRRVREMPGRERDLPAAALTANARTLDKRKMLDSGYTMHLAKPIEPTELVSVVATLGQLARSK
ncbi:MAG TPA: PAS domain S-box protein [Polyangiaceae bacterium]